MTENVPATTEGEPKGLSALIQTVNIKARFNEVLGPRRGAQFISSVITLVNGNAALQRCQPSTVITAAAQAAALDLPITPTIGQAAIVPYKDKAQFQIMTKGIIQLAHRTSKYKRINLATVYEGQLKSYNEFTGEVSLDSKSKKSNKVEGLFFFFELTNGYRHEVYWPISKCVDHGWKFSKSFKLYGSGLWMDDPLMPTKGEGRNKRADIKAFKGLCTDGSGLFSMCCKTVVKNTLMKWGPLSTDMQDAFTADQAVLHDNRAPEYIDSTAEDVEDEPEEAPPRVQRKSAAKGKAQGKDEKTQTARFFIAAINKTSKRDKEETVIRPVVESMEGDINDGEGVAFYLSDEAMIDTAVKAKEGGEMVEAICARKGKDLEIRALKTA